MYILRQVHCQLPPGSSVGNLPVCWEGGHEFNFRLDYQLNQGLEKILLRSWPHVSLDDCVFWQWRSAVDLLLYFVSTRVLAYCSCLFITKAFNLAPSWVCQWQEFFVHLTCGEDGHLCFISSVSVYPAVEVIRTSPSIMKWWHILKTSHVH